MQAEKRDTLIDFFCCAIIQRIAHAAAGNLDGIPDGLATHHDCAKLVGEEIGENAAFVKAHAEAMGMWLEPPNDSRGKWRRWKTDMPDEWKWLQKTVEQASCVPARDLP